MLRRRGRISRPWIKIRGRPRDGTDCGAFFEQTPQSQMPELHLEGFREMDEIQPH